MRVLLGLLFALLSVGAVAQTSPNFLAGQVLTATELNTAFESKLDFGSASGLLNSSPPLTTLCNPSPSQALPVVACPAVSARLPLHITASTLDVNTAAVNGLFIGGAGNQTTTVASNIGIGTSSMAFVTTGSANLGVGNNTLLGLLGGINNVAIGNNTGQALTTGTGNTAVGASALGATTTANFNTAVGGSALPLAIGGSNTGVGSATLSALTTGSANTAIGANAGAGLTTGSNNLIFGCSYAAQPTVSSTISLCDGAGTARLNYGFTVAGAWWHSSPIVVVGAAVTAPASSISYGGTTVAAGASTGGGTCPTGAVGGATVAGCIIVNIAGTQRGVPFF